MRKDILQGADIICIFNVLEINQNFFMGVSIRLFVFHIEKQYYELISKHIYNFAVL